MGTTAAARLRNVLLALAVAAPIASYWLLVVRFSVNVPVWDDYDTVLAYLNRPPSVRLATLLEQHNEHRIAWTRIVTEACSLLPQGLDFRALIYIGNAGLVLLFLALCGVLWRRSAPAVLFVPIALVMFAPQSWDNMNWATGALQNHFGLLFSFLALWCWSRRRPWAYSLASILAVVATYTSASGLLILVTVLAWEAVGAGTSAGARDEDGAPHSRLRVLALLTFTIAVACLYFHGYERPSVHPAIGATLSQPMLVVRYVLTLLGSPAERLGANAVLIAGAVEVSFVTYLAWERYDRRNPVVFWFLVFLLMSAVAIGVGRASFGVQYALESRYRVTAIVAIVFALVAAIEIRPSFWSKWWVTGLAVLAAATFNVASARVAHRYLSARSAALTTGIVEWRRTGRGLNHPDQALAGTILKQSIENGTYHPPPPAAGDDGAVTMVESEMHLKAETARARARP
jgi:hypothetical protein